MILSKNIFNIFTLRVCFVIVVTNRKIVNAVAFIIHGGVEMKKWIKIE